MYKKALVGENCCAVITCNYIQQQLEPSTGIPHIW